MTIDDRRQRDRTAQRLLITLTARTIAEREGWAAVTTRRLSTEIEYSQPVIYKHFSSLDDLVEAVALDGFDELAAALESARSDSAADVQLAAVALAYLDYAAEHPALYDAMFTRSTSLRFGTDETPPPLAAAYAQLRAAIDSVSDPRDPETLTEVLWSALHGLVALSRAGRLRAGREAERVELLARSLQP
ncbi:TetR/AcrR family transcriptional regulator [Frondihabitans sp. PhB188]|uniref:TetR/AcrR family transcriptional regulator n=1 Tax=Frondihabitans sp. PhB188 TaxID=2485200 RepID=UPI000F48C26B|nr:TetR/AcrR family transcriptional regulator [Frondihabitans sp. PhB188]